jgi:hypothetical protein
MGFSALSIGRSKSAVMPTARHLTALGVSSSAGSTKKFRPRRAGSFGNVACRIRSTLIPGPAARRANESRWTCISRRWPDVRRGFPRCSAHDGREEASRISVRCGSACNFDPPESGDRRAILTPVGVVLAGYLLWFWSGWSGDEGRGHDCADPARVLRARQADQGDLPGAAGLAQGGAPVSSADIPPGDRAKPDGAALGCQRVQLRARGPAAAEAGTLEGRAGSAAGGERGEAGT